MIRFKNSRFADEDLAAQVLGDVEIPQVGDASLISFDPTRIWCRIRTSVVLDEEKSLPYRVGAGGRVDCERRGNRRDRFGEQRDSGRLRALYGRKPASAEESEWV